ncbi:NAD(+) kinase [Pseudidiomarina terrestris]|uniref:NAD kinase n=1 Tax=Pseudidiomarina terrestris TaxID=2820060 RepID=A0AAW7QX20_9GAMM|nr:MULTISPECIES: NAD(+) kinase [unclassified Pseudidiomarina]MDN7123302.1 NAD(+) kinase [Pseudidiomarina sp. 1APP75-32.1]MDN7127866.1 NAD(+) kinase [Pseudidiomarina sp. 1APR75-33.1]MDN7128973.1 NAD(+) kinase [Pseudidiomarina sp. 1APR75-15]MDN7134764.1 NAD(+) kinase [Pseudidiomarina sp. 1ASP75-5]MDN7137442.1 NAD(+) kinase [Pseudidiomarina sp. 1ASP75-14]
MASSSQHAFQRVALLGKVNHEATRTTLLTLERELTNAGVEVIIEERTAKQLGEDISSPTFSLDNLGDEADLAVVVGGDGNMLGAARVLCENDVAVIGVNRGNLGFLTDLDPDHVMEQLLDVLDGNFISEQRFLLQAEVVRDGERRDVGRAINEVVLHSDKVAHMIEFEVYVDHDFVYSQRSDGLIISTPTGSTAYSLSGGGPILTPNLNAISLVSMFPHTLSSRPIVVDADCTLHLRPAPDNGTLQISCDGHRRMEVLPKDEVLIHKYPHTLRLIHPKDHSYFRVLRNKLGWGSRLF